MGTSGLVLRLNICTGDEALVIYAGLWLELRTFVSRCFTSRWYRSQMKWLFPHCVGFFFCSPQWHSWTSNITWAVFIVLEKRKQRTLCAFSADNSINYTDSPLEAALKLWQDDWTSVQTQSLYLDQREKSDLCLSFLPSVSPTWKHLPGEALLPRRYILHGLAGSSTRSRMSYLFWKSKPCWI